MVDNVTVKQAEATPAHMSGTAGDVAGSVPPPTGYVDFYGYHTLASGWCLAGWITRHDALDDTLNRAELCFDDNTFEGDVISLTFKRDDILDHDAVGFLIFLPAAMSSPGPLRLLRLAVEGMSCVLMPVNGAGITRAATLAERLDFLLSATAPGPRREKMAFHLVGSREKRGDGYIEYFGYHQRAGGWFFAGWVSRSWNETLSPKQLLVSYDDEDRSAFVLAVTYPREDLPAGAVGALFFVPFVRNLSGQPTSLSLRVGEVDFIIQPTGTLPQLRETELTQRLRANLAQVKPSLMRDRMASVLTRQPYTGEDTLDALQPSIFLYIDHAYACGHTGVLLMGWLLRKPDELRSLRLHCGEQTVELSPQTFVKISRQDVLDGFSSHGFEDPDCGFIAYVPGILSPGAKLYIEAETTKYEVGYRNIPLVLPGGMNAIRHILGAVDLRFADLPPAFERVLGPAVSAMNTARLASRRGRRVVEYGTIPTAPKYSVLVPLYGRLDFVEYQMGLFSACANNTEVEYIFVLDDPPKQREAQNLFTATYERFRIPFRAVLLERNLGFAPANNVGLEYCHGEYLVYLNSDVFPGTPDWLERLAARLLADPTLGLVGPLLLFEDGAVQHRGMYFEQLEEFGGWWFCQHTDKGLRYAGPGGMDYPIAITGACMMLKRQLAGELGGFDEVFAIGDFEDSDLCLRAQQAGLRCGVDHDVKLYHLERKSQLSAAQTWRSNLTLYNAWQHERRWSKLIAHKQAHDFKVRP